MERETSASVIKTPLALSIPISDCVSFFNSPFLLCSKLMDLRLLQNRIDGQAQKYLFPAITISSSLGSLSGVEGGTLGIFYEYVVGEIVIYKCVYIYLCFICGFNLAHVSRMTSEFRAPGSHSDTYACRIIYSKNCSSAEACADAFA